ncbi:RelA/SpoT family protein [Paenactinomyces guangxiensis]|uniref:GTP pyrophosphokinase n=1 Tax=Paenactinomyces guangxiensis TaxID=1490290 RepID=A0A7W1WNH8_9BACL|nr:bifunctional (p)ppGpp synthetase/guanosine-3',5'-bis(diphosphate) 3'-pyrophosphohydrolase [Paenactinomyces guangxiensis]MBA4492974.1 bifunctional (p)ppGpp synthetase/guanosine-3',5'-bis(diphosphate) 3'-pyrophosphohydrolase [Paenactinomyces guangxiensis]MBH8590177.1 bifunctional (p)ppGpp synthetase/guanosine-3',5'-bis(diphosphate) 3'-pyrophosphohydrolase [Paenactinomyces guangxiensis]
MPIKQLLEKVAAYLSESDIEQLEKAYRFAELAHQGQVRKSGEPYIHHPVAVAEILAELQMDITTLTAALLHDVVEDTGVTLDQIEDEFGETVRHLVDGVTKLKKRMKFKSNEEHQAENHRKMFVAMAQDIRVILIKLADRLHNMRTLKYVPEHKQRQKSKETLEIFAPLAHRLGISKIKWELEDISLRYLNPKQYYRIVNLMKKKRAEREKYLDEIISALRSRLDEMEVKVTDISGRPKHIYSIYRKMVSQNKEFNEIYDLMAVRIIVDTVRDCYAVLGVIHTIWKPMPGRFKDYIAMPKTNMYQSLHTTVIGPKGEPIEVQIRTMDMHRTAEYGIAAHWAYKEGNDVQKNNFAEKLKWFREMMELQQETKDAQEFVESLKMDWFSDEVFVFTPKGDVIELPAGSVPLDFAYRIHTEIGNKCIGAKVNGKIVPLDYKLNTGDIVEILTSKHSYGPSQDWIKIVKSSQARNKIRSWFKKQRREESIEKGKEMVEALLKKHDYNVGEVLTPERISEATGKFNFQDEDDMFAAVGYGGISTAQVVHRLTDGMKTESPVVLPEVKSLPRKNRKIDQGVRVKGVDNLLVRLSRCCNPVPGDDISGYVTQGRGVTVHRADCPNLASVPEERRISVEWDSNSTHFYQVDIEVSGFDRIGLLNEVLQAVHDSKTNLSAVSAKGDRRGIASIHIRLGIQNINHLKSVVERVKKVRDIYSVRRIIQ